MPSTIIRAIDYEPQAARLSVSFMNGHVHVYEGVPADLYRLFRHARSKGEFFRAAVRDRFPCRESRLG